MIVFILGGAKSGKSMLAQCFAKHLHDSRSGRLYYAATMIPYDTEDEKRIEKHRHERENWGFETIEEGFNLQNHASSIQSEDVVLLDSVTAFVQNVLFSDNDIVNIISNEDLSLHIKSLSKNYNDLIIVSDYIFSDSLKYSPEIERYKKLLGRTHQEIAAFSQIVIECAYSNIKVHKNSLNYDFSAVTETYNKFLSENLHGLA